MPISLRLYVGHFKVSFIVLFPNYTKNNDKLLLFMLAYNYDNFKYDEDDVRKLHKLLEYICILS